MFHSVTVSCSKTIMFISQQRFTEHLLSSEQLSYTLSIYLRPEETKHPLEGMIYSVLWSREVTSFPCISHTCLSIRIIRRACQKYRFPNLPPGDSDLIGWGRIQDSSSSSNQTTLGNSAVVLGNILLKRIDTLLQIVRWCFKNNSKFILILWFPEEGKSGFLTLSLAVKLLDKYTGHSVKIEFQINNEWHFSISMYEIYLGYLFLLLLFIWKSDLTGCSVFLFARSDHSSSRGLGRQLLLGWL